MPEKLQEFIWSLLTFWRVSKCWLAVSRVSRKLQQVGLGSQDALNTVKHLFTVSMAPGQILGFGLGSPQVLEGLKGLVWWISRGSGWSQWVVSGSQKGLEDLRKFIQGFQKF